MSSSVRPQKQPRGNAAPNLLTQALNSGTVPQRAEKKRKRPSGKDGSSSELEDLNRGTISQRAEQNTQAVERSSEHSQRLMQELRALGYFPKESGNGPERRLAVRLRKNKGKWTADQLEEIDLLKAKDAEKARADQAASIMEQIRALGYN